MPNDYQDIINFIESGLNWDDDMMLIPPGHGRNMTNVISSDDNNFNVKTNLKGNTLQATAVGGGSFSYPTGTLRVCGFVEDKEVKAGVFFVQSSVAAKDAIIRFLSETNELEYIVTDYYDNLNFPTTGFIHSEIIGNEDDRYLIWVGGDNEPRGTSLSTPAGGGVPSDYLRFHRVPYVSEDTNPFYYNIATSEKNNLRGKIFQFAIRSKFVDDNSISVLSPFTIIPIPTGEEYADGIFGRQGINGAIGIYLGLGAVRSSRYDYELCYRVVDVGSGSPSQWYLSGCKFNSAIHRFDFTNSETGILIPKNQSNKIQDYIPDRADTVTVIDENRIVFGGVTEGYDNLDPDDLDITFTESISAMTSPIDNTSVYTSAAIGGGTCTLTFDHNYNESLYYKILITGDVNETFVYSDCYGVTETTVRNYFLPLINILTDISAAAVSTDKIQITNNTSDSIMVTMIVIGLNSNKGSFKLGSKLFFGLQYLKDGKPWFVQGNTDADSDNNPFIYDVPNASDLQGTHPSLNYYYSLDWEINHLPPQEATHWQWVFLGSNIDYYESYLLNKIDDITHEENYSIISKTIVSKFRKAYGDDINYGFDIQKGDRVRFVGYFARDYFASGNIFDSVTVFSDAYDFEILSVNSTEIRIKNIEPFTFFSSHINFYIQIIRYKQVSLDAGIYQAASPIYDTYSVGGTVYHSGPTSNQDVANPAVGSFDNIYFNNCFISYQVFLNSNNRDEYSAAIGENTFYSFMEKHSASLLYDSNIQQFGRPNIINEYAEQKKWNKIRYGLKYLDESGVNYMRSFDYDGERFLDDRNGSIIKLQQIGDTLKAYQQRKVTSFYLKTTTGTNADGSQTMVFSDNVMSDGRQAVSDYGCSHYSSYVKTTREAYFFDMINAVVINDTIGGMFPISDLKMHSYFKQKVRDIIEYGEDNVVISGGWDDDLDMYFITFYVPLAPRHDINDTVGFYPSKNRWESFYSFVPEYYGKISGYTGLVFKDGQLYTQNTNETRNNFFGENYESVVDIIAKGDPSKTKTFESISIISNGQWSPSHYGDVEVQIPEVQQSRLLPGKFKVQEGTYNSEFLRNALDGNSTFVRNRLQTGKVLRGNVLRVRLRNSDTDEANLRLVTINSKISDNG